MSPKKYRGNSRISSIEPDPGVARSYIEVVVPPEEIYFLTRVFEGYSHLAFVSPIKPKSGLVAIHTTPGTYPDVLEVLAHYPRPLTIIRS